MTTLRYIYSFFVFAFLIAAAIAGFNYAVDPQCIFRCDTIDGNRPTTNGFYRMAQIVARHPDIEQIIVGSSRGEGMPYEQIEKATGLKTANLSTGGADLTARLAFANYAVEKLKLKRIIWQADYFEILTENASAQMKLSPALMKYVPEDLYPSPWKTNMQRIARLLDKDTTEASIRILLDGKVDRDFLGEHNETSRETCLSTEYEGKTSAEELPKQVHLLYENYTRNVFVTKENKNAMIEFVKAMKSFAVRNIEVDVIIPPYHPIFLAKLKAEHPEVWERHLAWLSTLQSNQLKTLSIMSFISGFPGDKGLPGYWEDGVHFTCKGFQLMLEESF